MPFVAIIQIIEGMRIIGWYETLPGLFWFYVAFVALLLIAIIIVEIRFCLVPLISLSLLSAVPSCVFLSTVKIAFSC